MDTSWKLVIVDRHPKNTIIGQFHGYCYYIRYNKVNVNLVATRQQNIRANGNLHSQLWQCLQKMAEEHLIIQLHMIS